MIEQASTKNDDERLTDDRVGNIIVITWGVIDKIGVIPPQFDRDLPRRERKFEFCVPGIDVECLCRGAACKGNLSNRLGKCNSPQRVFSPVPSVGASNGISSWVRIFRVSPGPEVDFVELERT